MIKRIYGNYRYPNGSLAIIDLDKVQRLLEQPVPVYSRVDIIEIIKALKRVLNMPPKTHDTGATGAGLAKEIELCGLFDEVYEQALTDMKDQAGVVYD